MTLKLYDYQEEATETLRSNIRKGIRSQLLCVPTGGGKTVISAAIIQGAVLKGSFILFLAHRRELIEQSCAKLEDFGVLNYSVIMSGDKRYNPQAKVHVASIQTLMKREFPPADLIIIDEAHRAASKSYRDVLANYPKAKVIGLSATPERLDGKGVDDIFDELVEVIKISELINRERLIKPTLYTGKFDSTLLAGIKKRQGDYAEGELQEAMDTPKLVGDIIANGLEEGSTYREISDVVDELLDNPTRSDIISITETNRAFNASAIDEYQAAEMPGWEWLTYAGACEECDAEEGPHDFGDDYPPAHPSCRCAVVTQLPDGTTTEEESMEE